MAGVTDPPDVYSILDTWSGERFDEAAAQRIGQAPAHQLQHLLDHYDEGPPQASTAPPGRLRPFYRPSYDLDSGVRLTDDSRARRRMLLLYAHEVSQISHVRTGIRAVLRHGDSHRNGLAATLLDVAQSRPLAEVGALTWLEPEAATPLHRPQFLDSERGPFYASMVALTGSAQTIRWEDVDFAGAPPMHTEGRFLKPNILFSISPALDEMAAVAARGLGAYFFPLPLVRQAFEWHLTTALAPPDERPGVLRAHTFSDALLQTLGTSVGFRLAGDSLLLDRLCSIPVPTSDLPTEQDIAAVRRNSDHFRIWRVDLHDALVALESLNEQGEAWSVGAKALLQERLTPAANALQRSAQDSSLRRVIRDGAATFSLSSTGLVAGSFVGGHLTSDFVAAAVTTGVAVARSALGIARARVDTAARLQHYLTFASPSSPATTR